VRQGNFPGRNDARVKTVFTAASGERDSLITLQKVNEIECHPKFSSPLRNYQLPLHTKTFLIYIVFSLSCRNEIFTPTGEQLTDEQRDINNASKK